MKKVAVQTGQKTLASLDGWDQEESCKVKTQLDPIYQLHFTSFRTSMHNFRLTVGRPN